DHGADQREPAPGLPGPGRGLAPLAALGRRRPVLFFRVVLPHPVRGARGGPALFVGAPTFLGAAAAAAGRPGLLGVLADLLGLPGMLLRPHAEFLGLPAAPPPPPRPVPPLPSGVGAPAGPPLPPASPAPAGWPARPASPAAGRAGR